MCQKPESRPPLAMEIRMDLGKTIRESVSTKAFCESVGIVLDRHGNCLCPFHSDTNKSLKVYNDPSRGWTCFGCHRGGTVIDFAMLWYGIDFKQAVVRLDADFNLGLPIGRKRTAEEQREARRQAQKAAEEELRVRNDISAANFAEKNAHNALCVILSIAESNRPKRPSEPFSDVWAEAVKILPEVRDDYERALDALNEARKEGKLIGSSAKTRAADCAVDQRGLSERCAI